MIENKRDISFSRAVAQNLRERPMAFAVLALAGVYGCLKGAFLLANPGSRDPFLSGMAGLAVLGLGAVALACLGGVRKHGPVAVALAVYLMAEGIFLVISHGPVSLLHLAAGADILMALLLLMSLAPGPGGTQQSDGPAILAPGPETDERLAPEGAPQVSDKTRPLDYPQSPPPPTGRKDVGAHALLEPGAARAGDFYRSFFLSRDLYFFFLGNVAEDSGLTAPITAAAVALLRAGAEMKPSPAEIAGFVNEELAREGTLRKGVRLFLGVINSATGELGYVNAGAPPAFLARNNGKTERFDQLHGPALGRVRKMAYRESRAALSGGDLLLLGSSGLAGEEGKGISLDELEASLSEKRPSSAEEAARLFLAAANRTSSGAERAGEGSAMAVLFAGRAEDAGSFSLCLRIANRLEEIERAKDYWDDFADQHDLARTLRRQMGVVLDEILNNVISYAYNDGQAHEIELRILLGPDDLTTVIADDGKPFNPLDGPDSVGPDGPPEEEGGMGLILVKQVMDSVSYERKQGENILTLTKVLHKDGEKP